MNEQGDNGSNARCWTSLGNPSGGTLATKHVLSRSHHPDRALQSGIPNAHRPVPVPCNEALSNLSANDQPRMRDATDERIDIPLREVAA